MARRVREGLGSLPSAGLFSDGVTFSATWQDECALGWAGLDCQECAQGWSGDKCQLRGDRMDHAFGVSRWGGGMLNALEQPLGGNGIGVDRGGSTGSSKHQPQMPYESLSADDQSAYDSILGAVIVVPAHEVELWHYTP